MSDPSSSVVPSFQASAPTACTTSTPPNSQDYNHAGYKKPTVEDFDEEEEKRNFETDVVASGEYDLSEDGDDSDSELDFSTCSVDTTGQDSEQEEPEEEKKNKRKDKKRLLVMEQAERFLRVAPAGISARVRDLMEKLARGEEVRDSVEDSEDEESDEDDMDQWEQNTKMAREVKRRHEEELIRYWMAKAVKQWRRMRRCTMAEECCWRMG